MLPLSVAGWLSRLEDTGLAAGIRQSLWLYPFLEIVHIVGLVLVAGGAIMFDLRLLGLSPAIPVGKLSRHLLPWSYRGLLLVIPSGAMLFLTNARALGSDPVFWLKMLLLLIAGFNALIFHRYIFPSGARQTETGNLPSSARITALVSITVWIAVIACGRLLAY